MNTAVANKHLREKREDVLEATKQYVTFMISNENYGVSVLKVQEIIGMTEIIRVPNSVDFVRGVINLRGTVVPVIDMRKRFNLEERAYDMFTVIIIVEINEILTGIIVDSVSDVVDIPLSGMQKTPCFSDKISADFIGGIGHLKDKLIIILDIEQLLSLEEIQKNEEEEAV